MNQNPNDNLNNEIHRLQAIFGRIDSDAVGESHNAVELAKRSFKKINRMVKDQTGSDPQLSFQSLFEKANQEAGIDPAEHDRVLNEVADLRTANHSFATMEKAYQQKIAVLQKRVNLMNKPREVWEKTKDTLASMDASVRKQAIAPYLAVGASAGGIAGVGYLVWSHWGALLTAGIGGSIGYSVGSVCGWAVGGVSSVIYEEFLMTDWKKFDGDDLSQIVKTGCKVIGGLAGAGAACYLMYRAGGISDRISKQTEQNQKDEAAKAENSKAQSVLIDSRTYPSIQAAQMAYTQTAAAIVANSPGMTHWPDAISGNSHQAKPAPVSLAIS